MAIRNREKTRAADNAKSDDTAGDNRSTRRTIPPNIKFAARKTWDKGKRKVLKDPAPIEFIKLPGDSIELPPARFQIERRTFYHARASEIIAAFPHLYKRVIQRTK